MLEKSEKTIMLNTVVRDKVVTWRGGGCEGIDVIMPAICRSVIELGLLREAVLQR